MDNSVLARALAASSDSVAIAEVNDGRDMPLIYANTAFERLTGYAAAECVGKDCRFLAAGLPRQAEQDEIAQALRSEIKPILGRPLLVVLKNRRKDGSEFWNELSLSPIEDAAGKVTHIVGIQKDVTEHVQTEQALLAENADLERQILRCPVTALPNRRAFERFMTQQWEAARDSILPLSLMRVGLDDFQVFNSTFGPDVVDECLRRVAKVIAEVAEASDASIARYDNAEFALAINHCSLQQAERIAEQIRAEVQAIRLHDMKIGGSPVSVCVGGTVTPTALQDDLALSQLWRSVHAALYIARGGNALFRGLGNRAVVVPYELH